MYLAYIGEHFIVEERTIGIKDRLKLMTLVFPCYAGFVIIININIVIN